MPFGSKTASLKTVTLVPNPSKPRLTVDVALGAAFVPPAPSEAFAGTSGPRLVGFAERVKILPAI